MYNSPNIAAALLILNYHLSGRKMWEEHDDFFLLRAWKIEALNFAFFKGELPVKMPPKIDFKRGKLKCIEIGKV